MDQLARYNIIAFIGSMKYWDEFIDEASRLHSEGNIILLPHKDPDEANLTDERRRMYDRMIRDQIDMAEEVHVMNINGYIGKSTNTELQYAINRGKTISYYEPPHKKKIVTLCGSYKFKNEFIEIQDRLTMLGYVVLMPATFNSWIDLRKLSEKELDMLHDIHYEKIDMSDEIYVIDPKGYIGEDTQREINYAKESKKRIIHYDGRVEDVTTDQS